MAKTRKKSGKLPLSERPIQRPKIDRPAKRAKMSKSSPKKSEDIIIDLATSDDSSDVEMVSVTFPGENVPTDFEIINIYQDISKLVKIEKYLNILYRPFVCFVNTKCEFKLSELNIIIPNAKYNPDQHSALFIKRTYPVGSLKVYANGNIYAQGYSRESAHTGLRRFITHLGDFEYKPLLRNPKYNVVNATFSMPFHVNLEQLHSAYHSCTSYSSKKTFLTYWMDEWQIKFAIFPTGFVYVMFSKQPRYTRRAIQFILPILYRYKKLNSKPIDMDKSGDIDYKLRWEREFQREDDFSIKM
ncbi:TATA-box-binding protein [Drosophila tropicalis]|uniref:TATA-box-binding protein n=1 Tax=Drosophila tropicalis TaxID=46794 RepID=UPI0035AC0BED